MKEPVQRPFAGLDLRRPKGYPAASTAPAPAAAEAEVQGDPCPRCASRDTKFCYYNNYNTSQPRHYCRSCRRYWTKGGSLRNVPVGGGSRKSSSSPSSSSTSSSAASPKRAKNSKRRRVALAASQESEPDTTDAGDAPEKEATAGTTDMDGGGATPNGTVGDPASAVDVARKEATPSSTVDDPATAVDAARTEATADGAMDGPGAPPAVDDADPSVALGLGAADVGAKEPSDASPFEWPPGCDLGSYWAPGPGVFADTDPVLFLSLP